jgi:uncharacterized protein (TIGR03437 family)
MKYLTACLLGAALAGTIFAQPTITQIQNNYSYTLPGLPNYGIAQGSIFALFGKNLAPSNTGLQSPPLPKQLNNVSLSVTVNGVTTTPILYYVTTGQIGGILPSSTPVGTGTITVTVNGQTSDPAPITVVAGAFGLLTLNGGGSGSAAAFDGNNNNAYLGFTAAANPGDTIILWGSGLGPVTGDETQYQTQVNMTTPIEVDIGGKSAKVDYHGRSQFAGLDQINVEVPAGVSGCYVSVAVITNNIVSNFATIPVAASGRTCSDTNTGLSATALQQISNLTNFSLGSISIGKTTTPGITVSGFTVPGSTTDSGDASFAKYTLTQFDASGSFGGGYLASIGSCIVFTFSGSAPTPPTVNVTPLNAGPAINVNGPNGTKSMPYQDGFYSATLGGGSGATALPIFIPSTGGVFKFDNGSGGPDVGAFTAQITLAAPLVWSNMSNITTVTRSNGQLITWTGGDPDSYVEISGFSLNQDMSAGAGFVCQAPVAAQTFTIPSAVLLSLPVSASIGGISTGSLAVGNYTNPQTITVPNVDYAFITGYSTSSALVAYQ